MSGEVRVLEESVEREPRQAAPAPWTWLLIGFVVGIGAGVVFLAPALSPTATTQPEVEETAPVVPGRPSEESGIADVVTDFPDALVGLAETQLGSYEYVLWPYASDSLIRGLPLPATGGTIDVSGTWVAGVMDLPESGGAVLSMGQVGAIQPVATKVDSHSWHDSREGQLAYIIDAGAESQLWTTSLVGGSREIVALPGLPADSKIVTWGDWGYVVSHPESGGFDLLTPDGELKTNVDGVPVASHPSGWVLVVDEGITRLVSSGGGVRGIPDFPRVEGSSLGGAISPDGERVAVIGANGLAVGRVDGSEKSVLMNTGFRTAQVSWSSDSRFVMAPSTRGATVFDTGSWELTSILGSVILDWVGVIPLTPAS
jgi:hypothetical protein